MKKLVSHEVQLIEGQFSPTEAMKMLMSLFNSKINYHQLESFSNQIRFDDNGSQSQKKIESLTKSGEILQTIIKEASNNGKQLKIESVIKIVLIN